MRLIKPSFEIIPQQSDLEGVYKQIELVGRTCYKSEDKITPDSAKSFVDRMIKSSHGAMLEHGTIYLHIKPEDSINGFKYRDNKYSKFIEIRESEIPSPRLQRYITTNLRVLVENDWLDDLQYICEPTEHHEKRITVRFICDRGVTHEFVRHRVFSFAQESTRYCNYSKDKFNNQITFIQPTWITLDKEIAPINELCLLSGQYERENPNLRYLASLVEINYAYILLLNKGWTPQQARSILPNSLKTELVMTGFISDWKHFFMLRIAKGAHPQVQELAIPLQEKFKQLNLIL